MCCKLSYCSVLSIGYVCGWFSHKHKQSCASKAISDSAEKNTCHRPVSITSKSWATIQRITAGTSESDWTEWECCIWINYCKIIDPCTHWTGSFLMHVHTLYHTNKKKNWTVTVLFPHDNYCYNITGQWRDQGWRIKNIKVLLF